jgi:hypothetical protein
MMEMSYSGLLAPHLRREWGNRTEQLRVFPRRSWKVVGVAAALLLAHQGHGAFQLWGKHGWFERAWMALIGFCVLMLFVAWVGEFFGTEIWSVSGGELIVSRGIGPLRRTFRYKVSGIRELTSGSSKDDKGKSHVHYIFYRPKSGAVRFVYQGKTLHFADWLDEDEGEEIVRWLRPRLPRNASELVLGLGYAG